MEMEKFEKIYMKLNVRVTPKIHAVFHHVEEFCTCKGRGLGPWSEQTSESLHHEFNECWNKYIIKDEESEKYGDRLLKAVNMFNNLNL